MKTASPLGQGGTSGGFGAVIDNLVWVVDPETHPGASRHPSDGGDFHGSINFRSPPSRLPRIASHQRNAQPVKGKVGSEQFPVRPEEGGFRRISKRARTSRASCAHASTTETWRGRTPRCGSNRGSVDHSLEMMDFPTNSFQLFVVVRG